MKKSLSQLNNRPKKKARAKRFVAILSAIAVFVTTYALILPAITIDDETAANEPGLDMVVDTEHTDASLNAEPDFMDGRKESDTVTDSEIPAIENEEISMPAQTLEAEVNGVDITVEADEGALPEGSSVTAETVIKDYVANAVAEATDGGYTLDAVKIGFENADGESITPEQEVTLTLSSDAMLYAAAPVVVGVDSEIIADASSDGTATVTISGETTFALVETGVLTSEIQAADGPYSVKVTYDKDRSGIPEGSHLSVTNFTPGSEDYEKVFDAVYGKFDYSDEEIAEIKSYYHVFDISIISPTGEKIEPENPVQVEITALSLPEQPGEDVDELNFYVEHIKEEGGELRAEVVSNSQVNPDTATISEDGAVAKFTVDSFSYFTMSYTYSRYGRTYRLNLNVHYVDENGNEISASQSGISLSSGRTYDLNSYTSAVANNNYQFMEARYGTWDGDRIRYVQTSGSGTSFAAAFKNQLQYSQNSGTTPQTVSNQYINVIDYLTASTSTTTQDLYLVYRDTTNTDPGDNGAGTGPSSEINPLQVPDHHKILTPNYTDGEWNGTYTLSLDVVGEQYPRNRKTKADVLIVYDTSNSMYSQDVVVSDNTTERRYEVAHDVVSSLAHQLLGNNVAGEDPAVRIGLVSYRSTSQRRFGYVSTQQAFDSGFAFAGNASSYGNGQSSFGGTNWEDGLLEAISLYNEQHRSDAEQYIIFISDGEPTCRTSEYGSEYVYAPAYDNSGNTTTDTDTNKTFYSHGYGTVSNQPYTLGVERCYTAAKDEAKYIVDQGVKLYSVGLFNDEVDMKRMNYITNYAYTGFDNAYRPFDSNEEVNNYYYSYAAPNSSDINRVFEDIVEDISKVFAYQNVGIEDTMSASASTSLSIMGHANDFVYYKNNVNDPLTAWTPSEVPGDGGAPAATFNNGTITWDLSSIGKLEDNMKYTVAFTVWPNQDAYDCVLELNTAKDAGATQAELAAIAARYPDVAPYLGTDNNGNYTIDSNSGAELTYQKVTTINGVDTVEPPQTTNYTFPSMSTTQYYMSVNKLWNDTFYDYNRFTKVWFRVYEDGVPYSQIDGADLIALDQLPADQGGGFLTNASDAVGGFILDSTDADQNNPLKWIATIPISPGIIVTSINGTTPLNDGHTYTLEEVGYWDWRGVFHPKEDDYRYEFNPETVTPMFYDGVMTYLGDTDGDASLTGRNDLRGGINLYKAVLDQNGNEIFPDTYFTYRVNIDVPSSYIIGTDPVTGDPIWDSNAYPLWYTIYTDTDLDGYFDGAVDTNGVSPGDTDLGDGWGTVSDGDILQIKPNQYVRIINVPIHTDFTFEEINIPSGYEFDLAEFLVDNFVVQTVGANDPGAPAISVEAVSNAAHEVVYTNVLTSLPGFRIQKVDSLDPTHTLSGAEFELYRAPANWNASNGVPAIADMTQITVGGVSTFVTNSSGVVTLAENLADGTYYLFETSPPTGYVQLADPILITISNGTVTYSQADYNAGQTMTAQMATSGNDPPMQTIIVANWTGILLPHTGGSGTSLYTFSGIALICIAVLMYGIGLKRKRRERRNE